jgi:hypothetical protein
LRSSEPTWLAYRIVSIKLLEAAGESWWPSYFNMPRERLRVGGVIVLQTITIADERFASFGVVAIPTALYFARRLAAVACRLRTQIARAGLVPRGRGRGRGRCRSVATGTPMLICHSLIVSQMATPAA